MFFHDTYSEMLEIEEFPLKCQDKNYRLMRLPEAARILKIFRGINGIFIKISRGHSFKMLSTELISAFSIFLCVSKNNN